MASKSADYTRLKSDRDSDRGSGRESISKPDNQTRDQNEIAGDDVTSREEPVTAPEIPEARADETQAAPSAVRDDSEDIGDEELLEMLEQLSETIDTAHSALAGQQAVTPEVEPAEQNFALQEQAHGLEEQVIGLQEQASELEDQASVMDFALPPPLPGTPVTKKSIVPALATIFSVIFGFAALAAMWLFWNSPDNPRQIDLAKGQDRISGVAVSRSVKSEDRAPAQVAVPARTAAPLQPATPIDPAPARESVPQAVQAPEPVAKSIPLPAPLAQPVISEPPVDVAKNVMAPPADTAAPTAPAAQTAPATPAIEVKKEAPQAPAKTASLAEPALEAVKEQPVIDPARVEKPPAPPSIGKAEEAALLKRGRGLVDSGDVASARLAYEYAALGGSADAMFALAQTYDPDVLSSWNVYGIEPDAKIALEWYGRAAQEGHDGADARASELEKLSNR